MAFEKATYEDLYDDHLERLLVFRDMNAVAFQAIRPVWVTEDKADEAYVDFKLDRNCIVNVSVKSLLASLYLLELPTDELFTDDANDFRYVTTLERWQKGDPVDPPTVYISNADPETLTISDGRHRTVLANYLNEEFIPIIVHQREKDRIMEIMKGLGLKPRDMQKCHRSFKQMGKLRRPSAI